MERGFGDENETGNASHIRTPVGLDGCGPQFDQCGGMKRPSQFLSAAALALAVLLAQQATSASKRELAASHYKSASRLYEDLAQVPRMELRLRQYQLVIAALQAVHRTDPTSGYSDDALLKVAELYERMADRFGRDSFKKKAAEAYRFAAREYPHSTHREEALAAAARLDGGGVEAARSGSARARAPESAPGEPPEIGILSLSDERHESGQIVRVQGAPTGHALTTISEIRHHSYDDGTRVVLVMDGRTALKYDLLPTPDRLYIDLFGARMSATLIKGVTLSVGDALMSAARLAQNRRTKARLVLDLKSPVSFDAFWLDHPNRLVLDIRREGASRAQRTEMALGIVPAEPPATRGGPPAVPRAAEATAAGKLSLTRALGLKSGRIVIDAGHGGHDTGSIGQRGLLEKDVVLDISKRLARLLTERLGAKVIQTRESDVFVDLEERSRIANEGNADLMVSIHCNSSRTSSVRGIETYYLSLTSDPWALGVAAQENASSQRSIHELEDLLAEITLGEKTEESRELATRIQSSLHAGVSRHSSAIRDRGIRKAPFVVLVGARIPAVLVEIGFLSNRHDERLMGTESFRQEVAEHLFEGIASYSRGLGTASMHTSLSP